MSDRRVALGRSGEELAERFLVARGHEVLDRRFRLRHGEIDLVTRSGRHLYFVEVKTRRGDAFGGGLEALGFRKQRSMARVADLYVGRRRLEHLTPHLSVVVVEPREDRASLRFLPDAFEAAG